MQLADDIGFHLQGDLYGDVQGLAVDGKGRCVIHLIGAGRFVLDTVGDVLFGLEFHQGRTVVFSKFAEGGAHMTQDLSVVVVETLVYSRRAAAEQLLVGQQLLMNLKTAFEAHFGIAFRISLIQGEIAQIPHAFFMNRNFFAHFSP